MSGGLLTPLSPQEEIVLRRIAHGSIVVDARSAARLITLALIERTSCGLRLTPLGRLRFNALPKAPLLKQQRSVQAMTGYVEGLIEKAQTRSATRPSPHNKALMPAARRIVPEASLLPDPNELEDEPDELPLYRPILFFFDGEHWKSRAERALMKTRRDIMEHRRRQVRLCDDSFRCIRASRLLLKTSVPMRPPWFDASG